MAIAATATAAIIPIPAPRTIQRSPHRFDTMAVGQSIFVAGELAGGRARAAALQWGRRHRITFTTRVVEEHGKRGMRIWRTQ